MDYTELQTGRSAAVLTTSEVAGSALKLERCQDSQVTVDLSFTLGALTNVTVRFYVSMDNNTWDLIAAPDGSDLEFVLTADTERCYTMPRIDGWKYFRASLEGSGATGGSSANYTYRYLRRGSQR